MCFSQGCETSSHQNKLMLSDFHSPRTQEDCSAVLFATNSPPVTLGLAMCRAMALLSGLAYVFRPTVVLPGSTAPLGSGEVAGVFALCGPRPWHIGQSSYSLHCLCALCQAIFPVNCIHILLIDTCSAFSIGLSSQCPLLPPINIVSLCSWG